ncbi:CHASE domain-containing protein [Xanthomonas sp. A2111]|uniref:histidine kinase n=1 Tax=Xanthomonas hawaiiensis TaxID=3003247 RepID=A0ABU2IAA2_9XANT|nr:CHASE domain-containing protein [Xanthomonas sp. A2111]MBO9827233.1 CHASE domain-containing protein [Xanthomonas sp. A2111]MDS9994677.1 CHASE domain-containing protein [Xanthomonas sp. A2111]
MSNQRRTPVAGPARPARFAALAVLAVGLLAALLIAHGVQQRNRAQAQARFDQLASHVASDLRQRLDMYEHGLRGARGAVIAAGGEHISRERFARYSASRDYLREFPGVRGFGYIQRVSRADEAAFLQQAHADGAPSLRIGELAPHDGDRFVIVYIQPLRSNNTAEGFDIASEPARRAAAIAAARSGAPTITAPIRLVQTPGLGQGGFLLLLPIYREGMPLQTPEQRWQATTGWAYAPLNIAEVLASSDDHSNELRLSLADSQNPAQPFYRDDATPILAGGPAAERTLDVYGRQWRIGVQATPGFVRSLDQVSPLFAGGIAAGIALLLAALLYVFLTSLRRRDLILSEQSQLAALVAGTSEAIVAEDLHGRVTHWNPAAMRIFGYTPEQAIGQPLQQLLGTQIRDPANGGDGVRELRHRDGHAVSVLASVSPIVGTGGGTIGHSHLLHDVTEQVRAQARVLELNATLEQQVAERTSELVTYSALQRAILANAGYAIVATDPDGVITLFNPAAETLLGYAAHELIGRKATGLFLDPEQLAARAERMATQSGMPVQPSFESVAALSTLGRSDTREWTYLSKDGHAFPVLLTLSTLRDDDDRVIGYLGIAVDLTEQKRHERELRLAIDAAETANQSKSDFLANMSHEIRTPMNAILGMLYLLRHSALSQAAQDMIQKIELSARNLLEIINDILDFSKIESGRIDLESAPFDLNQLLENIAALMTSATSAKPVEMIVEPLPPGCRWLHGDALRLNQVLINLVGNAIKFTEQGEVVLSVRAFPGAEPGKLKLLFSVRDTGIGIAREKQSLIFSPFLQADTSTSRRYGGSGLGLTISRRLVELMGGQLEVQSAPGQGSDFYFVIPFAVAPAADDDAEPAQTRRVLIADDHELVRRSLTDIANGFGWQVEAVSSGSAALAAAAPEHAEFDVILLDWRMPDLDGLSVAQRIRAQSAPDRQPIIVMVTAYERRMIQEQQPGVADVDAVMTKPVTASALQRTIAMLLARRNGDLPAPSPGDSVARLAGARLLVVDDSDINREVAQRILEGEGALVDLAQDGAQALQRLRRDPGRFHVVLMDVQMPTMDGYEATRQLRADPELATVPVIALTAGAYRQQQEMALSSGMNDFIAKPFQVEDLIAIIRRHLPPNLAALPLLPLALPPSVRPTDDWPLSDPALLDTVQAQRLWGERDPYRRYLLKLLQEYPDPAASVRALLEAQRPGEAVSLAHKLRGSAGSLALPALSVASAALEERLSTAPAEAAGEIAALAAAMADTAAEVLRFADATQIATTPAAATDAAVDPATLQASWYQVLQVLDSDDPDRIDHTLRQLAAVLPAAHTAELQQLLENFSFRDAEARVRQWLAEAHD